MDLGKSILTVLLLGLSACATAWKGPATITTPSGQELCAKHHVPLVTAKVYGAAPGLVAWEPVEPVRRIQDRYPCIRVDPTTPMPPYFTKRTTETYCPECEREYERDVKRLFKSR